MCSSQEAPDEGREIKVQPGHGKSNSTGLLWEPQDITAAPGTDKEHGKAS